MTDTLFPVRSALFLPASNLRAIEKARSLPCDMVILDLEDSVKVADKDRARAAAVAAAAEGFGDRTIAIRINGTGSAWHAADLAATGASAADLLVLPKVESPAEIANCIRSGKGVPAMIETPAGVLAATAIAAAPGLRGLIAGTNDLAAALRVSEGADRAGLAMVLQTIVLAARAAGVVALDGVWNRLDDPEGLARQCREGRAFGFDGKTLIHPDQIEPANRAFGPTAAEIDEAEAIVAAATGGAERIRGRMIEAMHVDTARRLLDLAGLSR
jgi:(3S)-malyl-CoA thioesterase